MENTTLQGRLERLAGFGGMNRERAGELLRLLPELGRVRTDILLYLTGLRKLETAAKRSIEKPNSHQILRVLLDALPEAAQSHDSRLGELLRHHLERQDSTTTTRCLTAMLRSYSDRLLHPAATTSPSYAADDDDDSDFGTLQAAEDEDIFTP